MPRHVGQRAEGLSGGLPKAREQVRQDAKGIGVMGIGKERSRDTFLQEERMPFRVVVDEVHGAIAVPGLQRLGFVVGFVMRPLKLQDETRPAARNPPSVPASPPEERTRKRMNTSAETA